MKIERRLKISSARMLAVLALLVSVPAAAQPPFGEIGVETLATGIGRPVAVTQAGDDRLFVVLRDGQIVIWDGTHILPRPFLDIGSLVSTGPEQGLLSAAFHPFYAENGLFFVSYTNLAGESVIARYRVSGDDPDRADPASAAILMTAVHPFLVHYGGQLQFGPDGMLYVSMGDGGGDGDPLCAAQRTDTRLGKLLRLDVDSQADTPPYFAVPPDNPFAGAGSPRDEIWAYGLRNPWRFSFDRGTGDLFVADVGLADREEVNFQPAGRGGVNYGWKQMEGTLCRNDSGGCSDPIPACGSPEYTDPILERDHAAGDCAIIGGYVYRGSALPELRGAYLYGDFCTGAVRAAVRNGEEWTSFDLPFTVPSLTGFGEDSGGEVYLVRHSGSLLRLTGPGACRPDAETLCLDNGRFRVRAQWEDFGGHAGSGQARPLTEDTGTFWFFDPANVELVVKVIDACAPPFERFWVFAGGLTNVEVTLTVEDTREDAVREYHNPKGEPFQPIQDTDAFATCP